MTNDIEKLLQLINQLENTFSTKSITLFFLLLSLSVILILTFVYFAGKKIGQLSAQKNLSSLLKEERNDAVKRSRSVIGGLVSEQFAPLLPDFPASYADARFLGKPVDFIAFSGLEESSSEACFENSTDSHERSIKQKKCLVDEILFIEVKTEKSQLSSREKAIKEAVEAKRVRWVEYRPDKDNS